MGVNDCPICVYRVCCTSTPPSDVAVRAVQGGWNGESTHVTGLCSVLFPRKVLRLWFHLALFLDLAYGIVCECVFVVWADVFHDFLFYVDVCLYSCMCLCFFRVVEHGK